MRRILPQDIREKTKIMAFIGKDTIRSKDVVSNEIIKQINHFNYLGCDKDVDKKVENYEHIGGAINRYLKTKQETKMMFYKVIVISTFMYRSELWP